MDFNKNSDGYFLHDNNIWGAIDGAIDSSGKNVKNFTVKYSEMYGVYFTPKMKRKKETQRKYKKILFILLLIFLFIALPVMIENGISIKAFEGINIYITTIFDLLKKFFFFILDIVW